MADKLLNLLGLACKAGYIVSGEDNVIVEMRKSKAKIVFVGSDSSPKTIDNFKRKCYFYKVPCNFDYTSEELGNAIGKVRHIVALCDANFYKALKKYLRGENNES